MASMDDRLFAEVPRCFDDGAPLTVDVVVARLQWRGVRCDRLTHAVVTRWLTAHPRAEALPDGRWVWVPRTLDGRVLTMARPAPPRLSGQVELTPLLDALVSLWHPTMPRGPSGRVLVGDADHPHPVHRLWAVHLHPEGVEVRGATADPSATARLQRVSHRLGLPQRVRWSLLHRVLEACASDAGVLRAATAPLEEVVGGQTQSGQIRRRDHEGTAA